ncbi:tRNA epoxyqueuosine(34) reductase QueG [Hyphobacterium sp. HN65]|uniref:Epoxyqueuosine reductase n=1 Tax=Hyphobacterium lacteum TaxID=3116575 RepID=A0ABU7LTR5_9PROT|nr:tRNA epoxyqueuosine(34) reductase QueG [Hyphobacterium sp. HN65]MEE2527303.1 tRNA epoxyqueuosine(34) reductase QueG [Hyphobacterium sp. HN65]
MMTWTSRKSPDEIATALGFDAVRICRADEAWAAAGRLEEFVAAGRHGTMGWMEDTLERRKQPTNMWPEANSALVVALNYGPDSDPLEDLQHTSTGNISVYARHRDYHDVMKGKLKQLAQRFARETGAEVKVFVDTAPLMEKPLAEKAGLGWQGKHTNLVSREHGSWLFLGVMLTNAELEPDTPGHDHCGACTACIDICPTSAFPAPYQLDARRCISYLTIEHAGPIPEEFRKPMGNRIYGCDDCLAVCPWNKFAKSASEAKLVAREDLKRPPLADLLALDDKAFRALFSGSPVKRIGRNRFIRNCLIAAGNSGDAGLLPLVEGLRSDPDPVVAEAADWAAGELN